MTLDLDTFLVALYTIVDDLYREHFARLFILEGGMPSAKLRPARLSELAVAVQAPRALFRGRSHPLVPPQG